jgi:hypothetical protein
VLSSHSWKILQKDCYSHCCPDYSSTRVHWHKWGFDNNHLRQKILILQNKQFLLLRGSAKPQCLHWWV